ncbi:hypothetical protein EUTSA_v10011952mg [Eutrema salsugineum]|uniref:DUF1677 family protein n=1 Tax=Eutrema salsugineum TaxID=72664 RepID=V4MFF9_EUTSA|nr:uncharacterized protein LOC18010379 [Eutrema salsugineum]ESQ30006.1 hypothetical protein EUTSA_v10011952mg [Eutrema salsugineum]
MSANFMATITESKSSETQFTRCESCGMTEEYTAAYVESVRKLYAGKLICGLCSEAVDYEIFRWGKKQRRIGVEEALEIHTRFCREFVTSPSPTIDFISAIGEMFRRRLITLDLPRVVTSESPSPRSIPAVDGEAICAAAVIGGNGSCLPALSGGA